MDGLRGLCGLNRLHGLVNWTDDRLNRLPDFTDLLSDRFLYRLDRSGLHLSDGRLRFWHLWLGLF